MTTIKEQLLSAIATAPDSLLAELLEYIQTRTTTSTQQRTFIPNPLREMQPYSYLADPNEPTMVTVDDKILAYPHVKKIMP
ncbi:hypothetical protein [Spirulina sp. 06S082]|uniref:hypothetical protein n=1 Tax=Spirulina sp. 06S082 TaxID=3110248 RepID=UPI002B1F4D11|nr:hypothetical protein [Spirulina sp. 06S082]MEA5468798.1 hypothetical protein [Spirulina sp. 06S082]